MRKIKVLPSPASLENMVVRWFKSRYGNCNWRADQFLVVTATD